MFEFRADRILGFTLAENIQIKSSGDVLLEFLVFAAYLMAIYCFVVFVNRNLQEIWQKIDGCRCWNCLCREKQEEEIYKDFRRKVSFSSLYERPETPMANRYTSWDRQPPSWRRNTN